MPKRAKTELTDAETDTLNRLTRFAANSHLKLFNVKGSLYDRVRTITRLDGACPCKPLERPHCPCREGLKEARTDGQCFCRLLVTDDFLNGKNNGH